MFSAGPDGDPQLSDRLRTLAGMFERLADMTRDFGGRLYPAKDAAMTSAQFQTFYPQWQQLARFRDPMLTSSFWERVTGERPNV